MYRYRTPHFITPPNTRCGCSDALSHPLGTDASCTLSPGVHNTSHPPQQYNTPGDDIFKPQNVVTGVCYIVSFTVSTWWGRAAGSIFQNVWLAVALSCISGKLDLVCGEWHQLLCRRPQQAFGIWATEQHRLPRSHTSIAKNTTARSPVAAPPARRPSQHATSTTNIIYTSLAHTHVP